MNNHQYNREQPPGPSKEGFLTSPLKPSEHRENAPGEEKNEFAPPAIEFRNVDFSYGHSKVLDALSFQVAKGEIKIILSGSGGGKSTILN